MARGAKDKKPDPYRVVCISLYESDIARMDDLVNQLRSLGAKRVSRSKLIRMAVARFEIDDEPDDAG